MTVQALVRRARRAAQRPPRYIATRLLEIARHRLRRPWESVLPRLVTPRFVSRAAGAPSIDALWERQQQAPFFVRPFQRDATIRAFHQRFPAAGPAIVGAADRVLRHEFDLLGSGCVPLGFPLPWHTDFKTNYRWPLRYGPDLDYNQLDKPTDVKVPWELSRCQHFTLLGQAFWLTGDERYPQEFVAETTDWIAQNPYARGVNWACAMDVALRAVSWIWAFYFMSASRACTRAPFRAAFLRALYLHGEYIAAHIERADVNGNHYLCDGVGLVFLGCFFRSSRKGSTWLAGGRDIILAELFNQTSEDGVDFEQSTAYHRLVLESFLTVYLLLRHHGDPVPPPWRSRLECMFEFVEAYTRPDGTIPLVGDADDGRVQKLAIQEINDHRYLLAAAAVLFGRGDFKRAAGQFREEAFWLLGPDSGGAYDEIEEAGPPRSVAFPAGGFYILRSGLAHVTIDCGEVGMRGRGGHGHNDVTSFELWLDGLALVGDCGSFVYTASREWRNRFRSTAFHNVVQVDGEELNRFISPDNLWQLHDDARPWCDAWQCGTEEDYFRGGHSGYQRLDPPVTITRELLLRKPAVDVLVRDSVGGEGRRDLVWRFHLGPQVAPCIDGRDIRLASGARSAWLQLADGEHMSLAIEDGWMSPSYGVRVPIHVVVISGRMLLPVTLSVRFGLDRLTGAHLRHLVAALPEPPDNYAARTRR